MAALALLLLIVLMVFGVPIIWSFAIVLAYLVVIFDVSTTTLLLQSFRAINGFVLLALPLFIMLGVVMNSGGLATRLVRFIDLIVKGRRGGMGATLVVSSGLLGAIAGTATAAVASLGTILATPLEERGYPRGYSAALLGMSSLLGILIPPSITMILFGVVTRQSIAALFAASLVPGIILMFCLVGFNRFCAGRRFNEVYVDPTSGPSKRKNSAVAITTAALPALCLPVVILGGIYGGFFSPTEAAAVAVGLAIVIGVFIYRELTALQLLKDLSTAAKTSGLIVLILLFSLTIGRVLVANRVPQQIMEVMFALGHPVLILVLVNVILLIAGAIMDDVSVTVVVAPLFMPLMQAVGVDPIQFGAIVGCSVVIAANSPPVAPILYLSCHVGETPIEKAIPTALLLIVFIGLPVLLLTTFVPAISLMLPRILGLA